MKKILLVLLLMSFSVSQAQIVNIPDINFKNALLNHIPIIDTNNDNEIQVSEAENTAVINVFSKNINSLNGIEFFTSLTSLNCSSNNISNLDLSNNLLLEILSSFHNNLSEIDISLNTALTSLDISRNNLINLDVSTNTNLISLNCNSNSLDNLDISTNTDLISLVCNSNNIDNLDVSHNLILEILGCAFNSLSEIDVSLNTSLINLTVGSNNLTNLDVSTNINLTYLHCDRQLNLTSLDVSTNTNLVSLEFGSNNISNIDVSSNILLTELLCYNNNLESLNITSNLLLKQLACSQNDLDNLDVSSNSLLEILATFDTNIVELDLSNNSKLSRIYCQDNLNLRYINFKNGNNDNLNLNASSIENLPNLETVCVDNVISDLVNYIEAGVTQNINFTEICLPLSINENSFLDFSVYPIPAMSILNVNSKTEVVKIEIYSKLGQLVLKTTNGNEVNISNLAQGLYFIKVIDINGNFGIKKVLKT